MPFGNRPRFGNRRERRLSFSHLQPRSSCGVPDQPRVEGFDRKHRQHHHGCEEKQSRSRLHRHQRLELDQGGGKGVDEHVNHRPAADELDDSVEPHPLLVVLDRTALHGNEQVAERHDLRARNHDAGDQHDQRQAAIRSATTAARRLAKSCRIRCRWRWSSSVPAAGWLGCNRSPPRSGRPRYAGGWRACGRPAPHRSAGSALPPRRRAGRETRPQPPQLCRPCCIAVRAVRSCLASAIVSAARGSPASAHSMRFHTSRGSKLACIAASRKTSCRA